MSDERFISSSEAAHIDFGWWDHVYGPMPPDPREAGRVGIPGREGHLTAGQLLELGLSPESSGSLVELLAEKAWYDSRGTTRPEPRSDAEHLCGRPRRLRGPDEDVRRGEKSPEAGAESARRYFRLPDDLVDGYLDRLRTIAP